jgi:hypothetical protein
MFSQIKLWIGVIVFAVFAILSLSCCYFYKENKSSILKYEVAEKNYRAAVHKNRQYSLAIDDV